MLNHHQEPSLDIVPYPHPTLRHKSKPIKRVDAELRKIVEEMFELMYDAKGIGLAANQVDLPIRLFIVNLMADPKEGEEMVFINPVISKQKGNAEREEGCLSLPGVYAPVIRPETIHLNAFNLAGEEIEGDLDEMMARVIQHENDHLDGIMFTDRLSTTGKMGLKEELEEFEIDFNSRRQTGQAPSDEEIAARLLEWETKYC
jgi:peptide deformylase